jgi:quercetin dioxygenase-like cupin family protein
MRRATELTHGQPADRSVAVITEGVHMHERTPQRARIAAAVAIGVVGVVIAGAAIATPGLNAVGVTEARGTLGEDQIVNSKSGVHLKTKGSVDVATQQITIGGGGHTGWHSHPGPVLVTIKSGALRVIYADDETCEGTVYSQGQSFIDRGDENVHIARNASATEPIVLWATYLVPGTPVTTGFRIDVATAPSNC